LPLHVPQENKKEFLDVEQPSREGWVVPPCRFFSNLTENRRDKILIPGKFGQKKREKKRRGKKRRREGAKPFLTFFHALCRESSSSSPAAPFCSEKKRTAPGRPPEGHRTGQICGGSWGGRRWRSCCLWAARGDRSPPTPRAPRRYRQRASAEGPGRRRRERRASRFRAPQPQQPRPVELRRPDLPQPPESAL
jgi:hypothetical protein